MARIKSSLSIEKKSLKLKYCENSHKIMVDNSYKSRVALQAMTFFSFLETSPITGDITLLPEIDARKSGEFQIMPLAFN